MYSAPVCSNRFFATRALLINTTKRPSTDIDVTSPASTPSSVHYISFFLWASLHTVLLPPPRIRLPWRALRNVEQIAENRYTTRPRRVLKPLAARAVGKPSADDICEQGERRKVKH